MNPPETEPTLADAVDSTLTFADRLRSDSSWASSIATSGSDLAGFLHTAQEVLLDPLIWIGLIGLTLRILAIYVLASIALRFIGRVATRYVNRFAHLPNLDPRRQRSQTLTNVLTSMARYVIWPIAIITILNEVGIPVTGILATAGVAGLAVGFGAQTLVRDVISGIFLLFDDTLHVGNLVRIGNETGTVEEIGMRIIKVRKFDGELLLIPCGELRTFGNRSIGFARAIVQVGLAYEQDTRHVIETMKRVAEAWAAENKAILLDEKPEVQGILDFGDSSVGARIVVRVLPGEQFLAERELRLRLKETFDKERIEIPFPRLTIYAQPPA